MEGRAGQKLQSGSAVLLPSIRNLLWTPRGGRTEELRHLQDALPRSPISFLPSVCWGLMLSHWWLKLCFPFSFPFLSSAFSSLPKFLRFSPNGIFLLPTTPPHRVQIELSSFENSRFCCHVGLVYVVLLGHLG